MTERLIEKLDRLAFEAGINIMTPEMRHFAMLVREDVVAQWPQRTWVGLTDLEWSDLYEAHHDKYGLPEQGSPDGMDYERAIEAKLKEKNT